MFDVCVTKFKNNQILLNKTSHRFILATKLFSGWKSLIRVNSYEDKTKTKINYKPSKSQLNLNIY